MKGPEKIHLTLSSKNTLQINLGQHPDPSKNYIREDKVLAEKDELINQLAKEKQQYLDLVAHVKHLEAYYQRLENLAQSF